MNASDCTYTLVPLSISKKEILRLVPEATPNMIDQTRKLKRKGGVWAIPDPYMGEKANAEDVRVALEYCTRDDLAFSVQSPNKKDVVKAMINDKTDQSLEVCLFTGKQRGQPACECWFATLREKEESRETADRIEK
ncbi:hypothetical protein ISCGN_001685 [Ixodes scapularis]